MSYKKQQELLRRVRKPLRVDDTMTMRETSGGIVLGVKKQKGVTPGTARWFRIIRDEEVVTCNVGESNNDLKCRDTLGCGGDDAPSIWGIWTDLDTGDCTQSDQDAVCTLIYFPSQYVICQATVDFDQPCLPNKWIGLLVQAFWNEEAQRWESDSHKVEDWDQVDFVRFCGDREALLLCGSGNCPDENTPALELQCCIFDGIVRRDTGPMGDDPQNCSYHCGAKNKSFDVWILCNDVSSLSPGQDCFPARRIDDAYTLQYCPLGSDGPMISETRPVYSVGCCGCGCPLDELYLEFFITKQDSLGNTDLVPCEENGARVTVPLVNIAGPPGELHYEGFFCRTYEIPVYLAQVLDPVDPISIFLRPDCETGAATEQWADHAELTGQTGGCCYTGVSGYNADPQFKNFQYDVLKQYISGGILPNDPIVCNEIWQSCRFCYRVRVVCIGGTVTDIEIDVVMPPGHPYYSGTPQEDPNAPLENLVPVGDSNTLVPTTLGCDGRNWYTMDLNFGRVDPITLLSPAQQDALVGWPHYLEHVFGGCCWDHIVLSTHSVGCDSATTNTCRCCGYSGQALDDCRQSINGCSAAALVKVGWNCRNDQLGL